MKARTAAIAAYSALAALAAPASARADEITARDERPLKFHSDGGFTTGTVNGASITKFDASAGLSYDVTRRMTVRMDLGIGTLRLGYKGSLDDGLTVDSVLWSHVGLSATAGASYRLYDGTKFRLDGYGEFETSLLHSNPAMMSLTATTAQGTFDVTPYADANTNASIYWNRMALGTRLRFFAGRFEPNLGLAFQRTDASLDLHLNEDSRKTVSKLGYDPAKIEGRHPLTFWSIPITPGLDYRLGERSWIGGGATFAPAGDSWLFGGMLLFRYTL